MTIYSMNSMKSQQKQARSILPFILCAKSQEHMLLIHEILMVKHGIIILNEDKMKNYNRYF